MKTDDLISALSADAAPGPSPTILWPIALAAGAAASLAMTIAILKVRPDLAAAAFEPRFLFKLAATLAMAVPATIFAVELARPERRPRLGWLLLAPALLALGCAAELYLTPMATWESRAIGVSSFYCAMCVPVFSIAPLAGILFALSRGAPTRQRLVGFVAGLAAGGIGATAYALHCTDDSPLFVAAWYSTAIAAVAALGAWLGPRVLRW